MSGLVFVDTNVLLYALDNSVKAKQQVAQEWRSSLWATQLGRISFQVLKEFYVNAIRFDAKARDGAREEIRDLLAWHPVPTDATLIELAWKIQDRYKLGFWDSLIVAAARVASCAYLLSEDLQPGQKFDGVEVLNPFQNDPDDILRMK